MGRADGRWTNKGDADDVGVHDVNEASGLEDEGGAVEGVRSDTPPRYVAETGGGVGEKGGDAASGG